MVSDTNPSLKELCHDIKSINFLSVTHDITAPTRLKSRTEISINGCLVSMVMSHVTLIY